MNITKHALRRMAERGFTPEMLAVLMNGKYFIKTGNDGQMFTSCDDCIRIAVRLAEEELGL